MLRLFKQKQLYGRVHLKIYLYGCLLNGSDDSAINIAALYNAGYLSLAANHTKLANEIHVPLSTFLFYHSIESVAPELAVNILERFIDLVSVFVSRPVQDIQRFLEVLKMFEIVHLEFAPNTHQPQDLFNRLPEYCAVQKLTIFNLPPDTCISFFPIQKRHSSSPTGILHRSENHRRPF